MAEEVACLLAVVRKNLGKYRQDKSVIFTSYMVIHYSNLDRIYSCYLILRGSRKLSCT